ncbi:MAG: DUF3291 domain-containing protein [Saprospiraceae bacterium]|nr:DUF3291 domain-containing protein [Saprospiraceae bacterium]
MKKFHLAQLNIARMVGVDINDPVMADFVAQIDEVNAIAESFEGFVWRLKDDSGNATAFNPFDDVKLIVNMSVWDSIESLEKFVFNGRHLDVMKRRRNWFERFGKAYMVLWWIPEGHQPTLEEAQERLQHLQENGVSAYAFDFRNKFAPEI